MTAAKAATRLLSVLVLTPIMLASSMSLFDRRKLLNTAAASILGSPSNANLLKIGDIIGNEDSRLSLSIATETKGILLMSVPKIGYSLYNTDAGQAENCVQLALQAGYRHFDVAAQYGTNEQVGKVLRSYLTGTTSSFTTADLTQRERRSELFISHKISNDEQSTNRLNVKNAVKKQMSQLSVRYLDLCYVHSPLTDPDRRLATYAALLELQDEGVVKAIGVCNYGVNPLSKYGLAMECLCVAIFCIQAISAHKTPADEIINAGYAPPSVIQLILSPFNQHKDVVGWAKDHGSVMSCNAWSKLSSGT